MTRIAIPSKGRLRDSVLDLLSHAGYSRRSFDRMNASAMVEDIEFIEMRPRDAAAWLAEGRLDAAFISTDTALENEIETWPSIDLGFSRSDLVIACKEDAPYRSIADLAGAIVATHLPRWTGRWLADEGVDAHVVEMGGSLEGVCTVGMADAIVDLRETGGSLQRNRLRVLADGRSCQATFARTARKDAAVDALELRIQAALDARLTQYVMLHLPADRVELLGTVFPGLAAPTVLPLAGREDLVAAHIVVQRKNLWAKLGELRAMGATGIVALPTDAILR
ncbi:MAG: ATP phosphoribosyltransferase [Acidimicrobiales bacterium]